MDISGSVLVDGQQLFSFVEAALWTSLRVGAALMAAPLIGTRALPARLRLMATLALAVVLAPLLPPPPAASIDAATLLNVAREIVIGITLGFVLRLAFEAGALAGELVAQGTGLAFAQLADPTRGGMASGVVGQWFYVALALLFLAFDGHLALIEMVAATYRAAPVGMPLTDPGALLATPLVFLSTVLAIGVRIALPVMMAMLVVNVSFGVLSRAAPTLNPIQVGLPAALFAGLVLMAVLTGELAAPARELFDAAFDAAAAAAR
ncbi:MAG: flagellar biosynthetic protein FliR [Pseudomonadota bacterium]